jgi:hypothetical protein
MGESGRQRADRGEAVRLGEMSFGCPSLRDIAPDLHHLPQTAGGVEYRRGMHFLPHCLAFGSAALADTDLARARLQAGQGGTIGNGTPAGRKLAALAAEHLLARMLRAQQE